MNNIILEITGGDRPPERIELGPDDSLAIGRQDDNDLVLDSRHVSRHHCRIFGSDGVWTIEDLASANGVRINGEKMLSHTLASGDEVVIHPFTIRVTLPVPVPPVPEPDDEKTVVISSDADLDEDATVVTSVTSAGVPSDSADEMEFEGETVVQPPPAKGADGSSFLTPTVRIAGLVCIILFLLGGILFKIMSGDGEGERASGGNVTEREAVQADSEKAVDETGGDSLESLSLEQKRERAMLLYQANNYIREGKYDMAANRLQAALEIVPGDREITSLLDDVKEQLEKQRASELERKNQVEAVRSEIEGLLRDVPAMLEREEFEDALDLVDNLRLKRGSFPELSEEFDKLDELGKEVSDRYDLWKQEQEKQSAVREKTIQEIKQEYNEGVMLLRAGKYWDALKHWNNVSKSGADIPEREDVEARLPELRKLMEKKVRQDYEKGLSYYRKKDYPNALKSWDRVLKIYPEHPQTKEKMAEILPIQEDKAKRLYQEGLVYEGINNISKAISKWKEAIKAAPVDSSVYYKKARGKLAEYGQK
jgi:pSer/pThr/pTyr-binding forkhead associated (FHA) protein/TolA-binding protein